MAIVQVCNYYLHTNYKKSEAKEKFEEILTAFLEGSDPDVIFNLDHFIDTLAEDDTNFEILSEMDADVPDIEYNEEELQNLVENILDYSDEDDGFYMNDDDPEEEE